MSPITHLMLSWLVAEIPGDLCRRDRVIITLAGVVPDLDGLGAIPEIATLNRESPLLWFTEYHHTLHTLFFAAIVLVLAVAFSRRRAIVGCLSLAAFHLHLMCDVVGARGPDGYSWPIPYLQPFSSHLQLEWEGQWYLNAWPNFAITGAALSLIFYLAWKRGYSIVSLFSLRGDRAFVSALRRRVPARPRLAEGSPS